MTRLYDMAVIGGGPAGAAFAAALAAAGRGVVLVERESGPHDKVCGEFLSGEALVYLDALAVDVWALGAVPIGTVRLSRGALSVDAALPFPAASLSRRRLDEALLGRAAEAGATVLRGSAARKLARGGDGWTVDLDDGRRLAACETALATGKHDMRGLARPEGSQNDLIGLKAHFRPSERAVAAPLGIVTLGLFPGGYAGLEPIEDGGANLCLLVRRTAYADLGRDWPRLLERLAVAAPAIGDVLRDAEPVHERPLAIARIPYGLVVRQGDELWRLGDQAAVIPSFAGEGVSLALHGAHLAAKAYLAGETSRAFQAAFAAEVGRQVARATLLSRVLVRGRAQAAAALAARLVPRTLPTIAAATRLRPALSAGA